MGPPKKIPPLLAKEDFTVEDLETLKTEALGTGATPCLQSFGYEGLAACFIGLSLDSHNSRVLDGNLYTVGSLYADEKRAKIPCNKLWATAPQHSHLLFDFRSLDIFRFRGALVSSLVDHTALHYEVWVDGNPGSIEALPVPGFCVRAYCYPVSNEYVQFQVLIYPLKSAEFKEKFQFAQNPGIPGILLVNEAIPLLPNKCKEWGISFAPLLLAGSSAPLEYLASQELRAKIDAILSKGLKPATASSAESLARKWEVLFVEGESACAGCLPNYTWPVKPLPPVSPEREKNSRAAQDSDGESSPALSTLDESREGMSRRARAELQGQDIEIQTAECTWETDSETEEAPPLKKARVTKEKNPKGKTATRTRKRTADAKSSKPEDPNKPGNWETLEYIWPATERPPGQLRDRSWVNAQSYEKLHLMKKDYADRQKELAGATGVIYKIDALPGMKTFPEGQDDCMEVLHPVRFLRRPLCSEKTIWKQVPAKRDEIYKSLDLKPFGAESQISERTIGLIHDRRNPLQLKYFHRQNAGIGWRPLKEERRRDRDSGVSTIVDFDWREVTSMTHVEDALLNFTLVSQMVWPYDLTGLCLMKLYNLYGYCPYGSERDRANLINNHFARVSEANMSRAARGQAPLDFEGMENILKKVLSDEGLPREPPNRTQSKFADRRSLQMLEGSLHQDSAKKPDQRAGASFRRTAPDASKTPDGRFFCYNFNGQGCSRPRVKDGCKDAKNREFVHMCTFKNQANQFCLKTNHGRKNHK